MTKARFLVLAAMLAAIIAFFSFDLGRYFSLEYLKEQQTALSSYYGAHRLRLVAIFFAVYVVVTGLSLPGAAIMTLAAGAIFGLFWGTLIVSFASTIGATVAFLAARFLLRDWVQQRFGHRLQSVNDGIARDGAFYLFAMRLVPAIPFVAINVLMALTALRTWTFVWVSQLGMLLGTIAYVYAGTQLAEFRISVELLVAFSILGLFPLGAKKLLEAVRSRRVYARWSKPAHYDRNVIVIGAGSAGLVAAYIAAAMKARVTLIEKHKMGGDCLNTGCVPSKALIRSARLLSHIKRAGEFGIKSATAQFDFAEVMERVRRVIDSVAPHDSVQRYTALGVECIHGEARITSPWTVTVNENTLTARNIIIATGSRPAIPPIPGIEEVGCLTSDTVWSLSTLPRRLAVLGGGPVGCELAQCFARLGSHVTQIEMLPRFLMREDPEVSVQVQAALKADGVNVLIDHRALRFEMPDGQKTLVCDHRGESVRVEFDALLCAAGRVANIHGYGLEELGIVDASARALESNEFLQTSYPNIFVCGDVAGTFQFTHTASHQAWYATVNALFRGVRRFRADYSVIPWATFTDPEVARVGLNELEARRQNVPYEVTTYRLEDLDRAIADGEAHGGVKVLTVPGSDRILGATIVGEHAADIISEFVLAMRCGVGMNKILGTIHIYPTFAEANKYAAGAWKRAHQPERLLAWVERYHAWMRR